MSVVRSIPLHLRSWGISSRASIIGVSLIAVVVFGILYLRLPILLLPLGLGVLLLALITIRSPTLGLSFVVAAQFLPVQMAGFTLLQILGAFVAVLCLFWLAIHKQGLIFPNIVFPVVVMMILTLYSLSFTRDPGLTQYAAKKLILNVVFCLLLVNVIESYQRLRTPLLVLMGIGVINSATAVVQFATQTGSDFRAKGLLENQNSLGAVAAMVFVLPLYHFLYEKHRWKRLGYLALCAILSMGVVTSVSRGATFTLVLGLLFVFLREKHHRKGLLILGGLALVSLPLLPDYFFQRFSNIEEQVKGTVFLGERIGLTSRGYFNKAGIKIWKAHPVLGVGIGSYGHYFVEPDFNPGRKASNRLPPHNIYIQALAETGLVGFLILLWWILQTAYNYRVAERKSDDDPENRLYLRSCEAITLFTLLSGLSVGNLVSTQLAMAVALSAVCRRCAGNSDAGVTAA